MPGHTYSTFHIPSRCQYRAELGRQEQCNLWEGHQGPHKSLHEELNPVELTVERVRQIVREEIRAALAADQPTGVLKEVAAERARQDAKWGGPSHDDQHTAHDWWWFIHERLGQRSEQAFIEVAALAVAAVESNRRKQAANQPEPVAK